MTDIATIRRAAGLTQRDLAERSGIAQPNIAAYESGTRRPTEATVRRLVASTRQRPSAVLADRRDEILVAAARHRASDVRVFGSTARGDDRPGSDLDLLVRFSPEASLFDQIGLTEELEDALGVSVDVVSEGGLGPRHAEIRGEARPV